MFNKREREKREGGSEKRKIELEEREERDIQRRQERERQ